MNDRHPDEELTPEAADRLLDAFSSGFPPGVADPLTAMLSAASAPGRPDELSGEDAAVAAFRSSFAAPASASATAPVAAATHEPPAASGRHRSGRRGLKRLLTVKVVIASLVAASLGGVALAAGTGNLPGQTPARSHPSPHPKTSRNHGGTEQTSGADPSDPSSPSGTHGPTVPGSSAPSTGKPSGKDKNGEGNDNGHTGNPHGQPPKTGKPTPSGNGNGNGNGNGGNGNGSGKGSGKGGKGVGEDESGDLPNELAPNNGKTAAPSRR
ncbi:hypothetical protein [Actinomadura oligospora]|uniref:hypothetical protein n=1 Tax=Actinomadura oligospora TaxID=111804 RepID=UPI0004796CB7|nr:hypothetical protein [Actinomadura oligospora]